jgi:hypothetical protein
VLSHLWSEGVEELDQEKLTPLLRLKYNNSISGALANHLTPAAWAARQNRTAA